MIQLGKKAYDRHQKPSSMGRWLVGAMAGATVVYLVGKALGLGESRLNNKKSSS
jgi:hypothetical protein